jgi:hypothetical protein
MKSCGKTEHKGEIMKITYFNDGGHGWYSVKRSKLESMGVLGKVSGFSYQRGGVFISKRIVMHLCFSML